VTHSKSAKFPSTPRWCTRSRTQTMAQLTNVGITASRDGLSTQQCDVLDTLLKRLRESFGALLFHHGCCVGGDEIGAQFAKKLGYLVVGHPPDKDKLRSRVECDYLMSPLPYLKRDTRIVEWSDFMIGLPKIPECDRSGTWFTIREARRLKRPLVVISTTGAIIEGELP
jgi:hypothetical protein